MSKLERFTGDIPAFASEALSQERTVFGTELISDDINQQINSFFKRGWGMVSGSDQPSLQDFNALAFTLSQLIAYLYQRGVSEFNSDATYYEHSAVIYDGNLWLAKVDEPTDAPGEMLGEWVHLLTLEDASDRSDPNKIVKRNAEGTFDVSEPTQSNHPVRLTELEGHKNNTKAHPAAKITYSNDGSGLAAEDVQSAVDEVTNRLIDVENTAAATAATVTWNKDTDTYSGTPFATPAHKAMRRCLVLSDGTVSYYLDEFDSTLKEDGSPAITNGTNGQVMVEIPQFYCRTEINGALTTWSVSDRPLPGYDLHPVFEDGAVEKIFIGAYNAVVWQALSNSVIDGLNLGNNTSRVNLNIDRLYSTPGNFPMVGLTRAEFRQLARNAGYQLYDYWMWQAVQLLWITEFGNWNSQEVLGYGWVDGGSWPASSSNQNDSLATKNGSSNNFGNHSGSVLGEDGTPFVTYRGIENVWGNVWQFIDGVTVNNRQLYVSTNENTFADDVDSGDYQSLGVPLPNANDTFIKSWQPLKDVFVPAKVGYGANSSTFIGSALWTGTGWQVMYVGGSASHELSCGVSCCNAVTGASSRARGVSSRLAKKLRN